MKPIERWFQGEVLHGVERRTVWFEPGDGGHLCLMLACESYQEIKALAAVVAQLFPKRLCACPETLPDCRLIHFNNHPDTKRSDIDKVLHTYHQEYADA